MDRARECLHGSVICFCGERHPAVSIAGSGRDELGSMKQPKPTCHRRELGKSLEVREVPRWLIKHRVKGEPALAVVMAAR